MGIWVNWATVLNPILSIFPFSVTKCECQYHQGINSKYKMSIKVATQEGIMWKTSHI